MAIANWEELVTRDSPPVDARSPEIEAQLAAQPEDRELVRVYADWLIEHQNPLGELVHARDAAARSKLIKHHVEFFFGRAAEYRRMFELTWDDVCVRTMTIRRASKIEVQWGVLITEVLARPLVAFVRELVIGPLPSSADVQTAAIAAAVFARPPPLLRTLQLDFSFGFATTDLSPLGRIPALTTLRVTTHRLADRALAHDTLEDLELGLTIDAPDVAARIRDAVWPRLRRLRLALSRSEHAISAVASAPWLEQLEELALFISNPAPSLAAARARLARVPRIIANRETAEVLDLPNISTP